MVEQRYHFGTVDVVTGGGVHSIAYELVTMYKRVIGLDVHQAQITACALIEEADGTIRIEQRQFGGFKRDRRELAAWAACLKPD